MAATFLDEGDLLKVDVDQLKYKLVLTETYNESILYKSIEKVGFEECGVIAVQLGIIGYGNRMYGKVIYNDKEIDIGLFFKKNNIKHDLDFQSKLKPEDITPRRLIRFYRYSVKKYLELNPEVETYLYKKYCLNKRPELRTVIFPGSEHLIDIKPENYFKIKELLVVYDNIDARLNTKIKDKIIRTLVARGLNFANLYGNKLT